VTAVNEEKGNGETYRNAIKALLETGEPFF
jgi:hypothetical protein